MALEAAAAAAGSADRAAAGSAAAGEATLRDHGSWRIAKERGDRWRAITLPKVGSIIT